MTQQSWLIEEVAPLDEAATQQLERRLPPDREGVFRAAQQAPSIAVRMQDIVIHNNRKWFGEADIRLDALVIHGNGKEGNAQSFYVPGTFHFPRITDGARLQTDQEGGLLVFYGQPLYFLDIFVLVSRDRKDSDELSELLRKQLPSPVLQGAMTTLLGLAVAAPQVAMVVAAVGAAAIIGDFAYQVLRTATGNTIGLYHSSWLQARDGFGLGRHPKAAEFRRNDLSFWYEVLLENQAMSR